MEQETTQQTNPTNRSYVLRTTLRAWLVSPFLGSLGGILSLFIGDALPIESDLATYALFLALALIFALLPWVIPAIRGAALPERPLVRYGPVVGVFAFYMLVWIVCYGASGYLISEMRWPFFLLSSPFLPFFLFIYTISPPLVFASLYGSLYGSILAVLFLSGRLRGRKSARRPAELVAMSAALLCIIAVFGCQKIARQGRVIEWDRSVETVGDSMSLSDYSPFTEDNRLNLPEEDPELVIHSAYPILDGATAIYPVYAATAELVYDGLDETTAEEYISCSTTRNAYTRLIDGETDIFFGLQPSQAYQDLAAEAGVELVLTPIAREAFVFFVSVENPVDGLTTEEIQSIYRREVTNWRTLGGGSQAILPFQRAENSGSQTIMEEVVMAGLDMAEPLVYEMVTEMGGMISQVADYQNYAGAIGYSFRYFLTDMYDTDGVKLLEVDGVYPDVDSIRGGAYPFTVPVYAVTTGDESENTLALIDWLLSPQGQRVIELNGYVGIGDGE